MKLKIALFLLTLGLGFSLQAQVLVVSDIDDTLKISHVLDRWDSVENAGRYENHFRGMAEIFSFLERDLASSVRFAYVTNAPKWLMSQSHKTFIAINGFPMGDIYLRDGLSADRHKLVTIQNLINREKPKTVILVGDNGEKDPIFYAQIVKDNPKVKFLTLIHWVYSVKAGASEKGTPLRPGQLGYVTSVEVGEELVSFGLLTKSSFDKFVQALVPEILIEKMTGATGTLAFPKWMNCSGYFGFYSPLLLPQDSLDLLDKYYQLRHKRCK